MESTTWSGPAALMEGWISRWIYMRLDEDRQTYFVLVDEDAAEEKYFCRSASTGFRRPTAIAMRKPPSPA
jgi:hypothetical protein